MDGKTTTTYMPEQLCHIPCNFCNIILAVSVPCSRLSDIVTVRCGHCTKYWSVNMAEVLHSLPWQDPQSRNFISPNHILDLGSSSKCNMISMPTLSTSRLERVINYPPGKKRRVPSAYNQFIKEEIQRIKANNPKITHREAFSTAAKNWAHFPHIHFGLMMDNKRST